MTGTSSPKTTTSIFDLFTRIASNRISSGRTSKHSRHTKRDCREARRAAERNRRECQRRERNRR